MRHRSAGAAHDLCLTVPEDGRSKGKVLLSGCVVPVPPNQSWVFEANGTLHMHTAHPSAPCLVLANARGPGLELFRCKPGGNEKFSYSAANGTLCTATLGKPPVQKCISARNSGPDGNSGDGTCQLWAKPQPRGAVAVFVSDRVPL